VNICVCKRWGISSPSEQLPTRPQDITLQKTTIYEKNALYEFVFCIAFMWATLAHISSIQYCL
jgi:hypothetical protein